MDNSNMASDEEHGAITVTKMESMLQKWSESLEAKMNQRFAELNAKLDGNTVEMNQRFAAVEERFVKTEAFMTATKEQIVLVEDNLNFGITSLKDEVNVNIERQISAARAEFQEVITETNQRVATLNETSDKSLSDTKTFANFKALENEVKIDAANKGVSAVASKLEHFISKELPIEVRTVMRPTIENLYEDVDQIKASVAVIETTVKAIDTKHVVTPDHLHVYFKALEAEIVELKASQLAAKTEADRVENRVASNANPNVNVRPDRHERPAQSRSTHEVSPDEWIRDPTTLTMGEETMAFMRENADSPTSKSKNRAKKKRAKSKKKHKEAEDDDPSDSDHRAAAAAHRAIAVTPLQAVTAAIGEGAGSRRRVKLRAY